MTHPRTLFQLEVGTNAAGVLRLSGENFTERTCDVRSAVSPQLGADDPPMVRITVTLEMVVRGEIVRGAHKDIDPTVLLDEPLRQIALNDPGPETPA